MRLITFAMTAAAAIALAGCPNPNDIGVQNYGSIKVTTTNAATGQPVPGSLVNAGSTNTCTTDSSGVCVLSNVPVGKWTVMASSPGLHGSADTTVTENNQSAVTIAMTP